MHKSLYDHPKEELSATIDKTLADIDTDSPEGIKLRARLDAYLQAPNSFKAETPEEEQLITHFDQRLAERQTAFNYIIRRENQERFDQIQLGINELLDITEELGINPRKVDSCLEALPFREGAEATNQAIKELRRQGTISPLVEKLLLSFAKYLFTYSEEMKQEIEQLKNEGDKILAGTFQSIQKIITEESSASLTDVYQDYKAKQGEEEVDVLKVFIESALVKLAFDEACQFYDRLISIAPSASNHLDYANLLQSLEQTEQAIAHYKEALSLYRELCKRDPRRYKPSIAKILHHLGAIYQKNNELGLAQSHYIGALKIYKKLAKYNPKGYQPDVAMMLNNLGGFYDHINDLQKAKQHYTEALKIYRQLAKQIPEAYLPHLAGTLNNVAIQLKKEDKLEEAKKYYEEALSIKRELARVDPQIYRASISLTLNNLAILLKRTNHLEAARAYYEEALEIKRDLARQKPLIYLPSVAITLNNLATLLIKMEQFEIAQAYYEEAVDIYRELVSQKPETYRPAMAIPLINLGQLYNRQRRHSEAAKTYGEGLAIKKSLAEQYPAVYEVDYAEGLLTGNVIFGYSLNRVQMAKGILDRYPYSSKAQALRQTIAEDPRSSMLM
ncbi:MAG: tetratricopeptide repeat protein [Porphyromonadaceae bacterium]|nr:tetratricopeptide repeat protein [Porphyromonadaceae bacterium]